MLHKRRKGLSLIELSISVALIAIIMSLLITLIAYSNESSIIVDTATTLKINTDKFFTAMYEDVKSASYLEVIDNELYLSTSSSLIHYYLQGENIYRDSTSVLDDIKTLTFSSTSADSVSVLIITNENEKFDFILHR